MLELNHNMAGEPCQIGGTTCLIPQATNTYQAVLIAAVLLDVWDDG